MRFYTICTCFILYSVSFTCRWKWADATAHLYSLTNKNKKQQSLSSNSLFSCSVSIGGFSVSSSTSPKCSILWLGDRRQYHSLSGGRSKQQRSLVLLWGGVLVCGGRTCCSSHPASVGCWSSWTWFPDTACWVSAGGSAPAARASGAPWVRWKRKTNKRDRDFKGLLTSNYIKILGVTVHLLVSKGWKLWSRWSGLFPLRPKV